MNYLNVDVVTFNDNERDAVDSMLVDMAKTSPNVWRFSGVRVLRATPATGSGRRLTVRHVPLGAQGNLVAGAVLARFFDNTTKRPDFMIFFGCAGAALRVAVGEVFLVGSVNYTSLGTVAPPRACGHESVTVKNKWICHTRNGPTPLPSLDISGTLEPPLDLAGRTHLSAAHVIATEHVIQVRPGAAPPPLFGGLPHAWYAKADWTYGEAIAAVGSAVGLTPVLVDMESYGIATMASAHCLLDRVVIVRVVTDDLASHADKNKNAFQRKMLMRGRGALLSVIKAVLFP